MARSTFYYQCQAAQCADQQSAMEARIRTVYDKHKGRYGYRRITAALCNSMSQPVNHKCVQRLMQKVGLRALIRAKKRCWHVPGTSDAQVPIVLQRDFCATAPNQKWATDVTEFNVSGQKLYLSACMDLYNGEIVAYRMARRPVFEMVSSMLEAALSRTNCVAGLIVHSDQGWHYKMQPYRAMLVRRGVEQSMSRKGNCFDNAAIESFFGTLKAEYFNLERPDSIDALEAGVHDYVHYYNHERIKLRLQGLSPVGYLPTHGKFVYLSLVTDAYSRKIVGWHVHESLQTEEVAQAMKMALSGRQSNRQLVHHSDRGIQYCATYYQALHKRHGVICSMTDGYDCYQNALAERVNGILKSEFLLQRPADLGQARRMVEQSVDIYNCERPHLSLKMQTPDAVHRASLAG